MKKSDPEQFFKYTRMSVETFDYLLSLIGNDLTHHYKLAIGPEMQLAITVA